MVAVLMRGGGAATTDRKLNWRGESSKGDEVNFLVLELFHLLSVLVPPLPYGVSLDTSELAA
jgi:hypothetical protein